MRYHHGMAAARTRGVQTNRDRREERHESTDRAGRQGRVGAVRVRGGAERAASGGEPAGGIRFIGDPIGPEDPETPGVRRTFLHPRMGSFASSTAAIRIGGEIRPGTNRGGMIECSPAPDPGTAR